MSPVLIFGLPANRALATGYRRLVELVLSASPLVFLLISAPLLRFDHSGDAATTHSLLVILASLFIGGCAVLLWRGYRSSLEVALGRVAVALLGATTACSAHALAPFLTFLAEADGRVSELFSAACRFQLAVGAFIAIASLQPVTAAPRRPQVRSWHRPVLAVVAANLTILALGQASANMAEWLSGCLDGTILALALVGLVLTLIRRQDLPVANTLLLSLGLTAQAAIAFRLGPPWNYTWWFGHALLAAACLVFGYGLIRSYLAIGVVTLQLRSEGRFLQPAPTLNHPRPAGAYQPQLLSRADAEVGRSLLSAAPLCALAVAIARLERLRRQLPLSTVTLIEAEFISRIQTCLRPLDYLSADPAGHLLILLPESDTGRARSVASRICAVVEAKPFSTEAFILRLSCHVGLAQYAVDARSSIELLNVAASRLALASCSPGLWGDETYGGDRPADHCR